MPDESPNQANKSAAGSRAGEAFYVEPPGGKGPGVLVLTSWWGLNDWARDFCRRLAAEGFVVICPDIMEGATPSTEAEGSAALAALSPDDLAGLVMSSAQGLRAHSADQTKPIGVVGFAMGASMAFWLAARLPESVTAVSAFYGTQSIDFDDATARFQGHFGLADEMVSEDDRVVTESFVRMGGCDTEFHTYEGCKAWFFEDGPNHNPEAAELAWTRTIEFLKSNLG